MYRRQIGRIHIANLKWMFYETSSERMENGIKFGG